jgi:DNA repair protein RecN (Recombination protein N)
MSGQFEQRRLARPAYQLQVLDAFAGVDTREARLAWRRLLDARRALDELTRDATAAVERLDALRALVEDTAGLEPEREDELRAERDRLRHVTELAEGAAAAATALAPEDAEGATDLVAAAERAVAPLEGLAPELAAVGDTLRDGELRLREAASELRSFLASLEADPHRVEEVEAELERIADAKRRHRVQTYAELLERAAEAREALAALDEGHDPVRAAEEELAAAQAEVERLHAELREQRAAAAEPFAVAVARELEGVGLGDGEFRVELRDRPTGPAFTGADEAHFLVRPNAGLPFAPVAETASGGELSRIALAIAAVGGGETMVFDEIDAGIGGVTAHAVAETLRRLAERAQVVTITHLPQIASRADRHFRVAKVPGDPTHTEIDELDEAQRRDELERMLGGKAFIGALRE